MLSNSSLLKASTVPRTRRQKQLDRKRKRGEGSHSSHPANAPRSSNSHEGQTRQRESVSAGNQSVKNVDDICKNSNIFIGGQSADEIGVKEACQDVSFRRNEGKVPPTPTQYQVPSPLLYHRRSREILTGSTETCQCYNSNGNCVILHREERSPYTSRCDQEIDADWQRDSHGTIMDPFEPIRDKTHNHRQKQPSSPKMKLVRTREIFIFPNSTSHAQTQPNLDASLLDDQSGKNKNQADVTPPQDFNDRTCRERSWTKNSFNSQFNVAAATRLMCGPFSSVKGLKSGGETSQHTTDRYSLSSKKSPSITWITIAPNLLNFDVPSQAKLQVDDNMESDPTPGSKVLESTESLSTPLIISELVENSSNEKDSETICQRLNRRNNHASDAAHVHESGQLGLTIETTEKTPNPDIGIIKKPGEEIWYDYHSCSVVEKPDSRLDSESNFDHDEMFVSAEEWVDEGWASDNSSLQSFEITEQRL